SKWCLVLKLSDNPPMLTPQAKTLGDLSGRWWVAHTRARFEKAFAWDLLRRGIGYFLPMVERVRISGGKKRRVLLPLFSSYVFFCGDNDDRYATMTTNRICRTIEVIDQDSFIAELTAIERTLKSGAELQPYPQAPIGQRCRVTNGVLKGLEGVVIQHRKRARLVLEINILGQGAVMEIDADLLEPVD
ncbi:unnamed protein product, partial [marine sediment metagenome]